MDFRVDELTPWQRVVYDLCWKAGASPDKEKAKSAGRELDRMKAERPEEYKAAFEIWQDVMFDLLY
jgi:hypothetical protein